MSEFVYKQRRATVQLAQVGAVVVAAAMAGCNWLPDDETVPEGATPAVHGISPAIGFTDGGTEVTIRGENFTRQVDVIFGGLLGRQTRTVDATTVKTLIPPHAVGTVDVIVRNSYERTAVASQGFEYKTGVTPGEGPATGGTAVTVLGTGFDAEAFVLFGEDAAGNVKVLSESVLTCVSPPHAAGFVNVTICRGDGSQAVRQGAFEYTSSISHDGGAATGFGGLDR